MYKRILSLEKVLKRKSVFLLGPRQTGKSTWLQTTYPNALYINLLSRSVYDDYAERASALESDLALFKRKNSSQLVIIDEVQKLPALLDEIHRQIEIHKELRFILSGSSARKLKRGHVNLLGGRASWRSMFPLVYPEIKEQFTNLIELEKRLLRGGLPHILDSEEPFDDLDDYIQLYLSEEIKAEGFVRNYEAFNRFLLTAALVNSKQVNFTELGNDAQIPPRTIHDYFQILEDTLIGHMLPAFTATTSRKAMTSAKFYLFDTGVTNALIGRKNLHAGTPEFGDIFEQFLVLEIKAYISYRHKKAKIMYWRSQSKLEVDIIIQDEQNRLVAIEVKGKTQVGPKDFKGLLAFAEDFPLAKKFIVTTESRQMLTKDNIEVIPVFQFLTQLWADEIF